MANNIIYSAVAASDDPHSTDEKYEPDMSVTIMDSENTSNHNTEKSCWKRPVVFCCFCLLLAVLAVLVFFIVKHEEQTTVEARDHMAFPSDLIIACASSAYQIEGGWDADGKGESIWDFFTHTRPEEIKDHSNGDVSCDSYHKYEEDVSMVKESGFQMYRFSISWSRVLPTGSTNVTNRAGINYYHNLIDKLRANGIEPMVTLYHWDLPQALQDLGGWKSPIMADYFLNFTNLLFLEYGHKVKWWISINEPWQITQGYGGHSLAPGLNEHGVSDYLAAHNMLRAHAKVYRLYDTVHRPTQQGKIGVSIHFYSVMPLNSSSPEDVAAAERSMQWQVGLFAHPIFSTDGDYPRVIREYVDRNSKAENRTESRLPTFTAQEIEELKGSSDFFGVNHYSTLLSTSGLAGDDPSFERDSGSITSRNRALPLASDSTWIYIYPEGFRYILNWIRLQYNNPPVFVTENGCTSSHGINDTDRIESYFHPYIQNMLEAIYEDGCNIVGYTAWSLMDSFEWYFGYTQRYGLWQVDRNSTYRNRTMKNSARFFKELIRTRRLPSLPFNVSLVN